MANRPIFPDTIKTVGLDIENADGTTAQTLLTAGSNGARVNNISVISDDTSAVILDVYYNDGATDFRIGAITVPTLAGTDGSTPSVSLLNNTDLPFLGEDLSLFIEATKLIKIAPQSAVTAAKKVSIVAQYGDY